MRFGIILAGAALTCATGLPWIAAQAAVAPEGVIVVADNNQHTPPVGGQHPPPSGGQHAPNFGGQGHMGPPPSHVSGNPMTSRNTMSSHNSMSGSGHMGGNNSMSGHNMMMGGAMTGPTPSHQNFNRQAYQRNVTATRHFHIGGYSRPQGWYSHHWGYGEILPALFWAESYWLNDYYDYDLPAPPPGFVWVRDGDDALLVDTSSGEILQVEYGVFD